MVKGAYPHHSIELPGDFLSQLDPKLSELYSQLPSEIASRVAALVSAALPERIRPDRVLKFAYLYAAAERLAQDPLVSTDHTRRAKLELAGQIHEFHTGYRDDVEAKDRYRRGRRARQQIKASLESFMGKWRVFERVVRKHRSELPVHVQSRYSHAIMSEIEKKLNDMAIATVLDEGDLASENGRERGRSEIAQAYIWWFRKMASYRGKWADMHRLALVWHMSPSTSVTDFRAVVYRICKGVPRTYAFEKSWDSVLSEKL